MTELYDIWFARVSIRVKLMVQFVNQLGFLHMNMMFVIFLSPVTFEANRGNLHLLDTV